MATRNPLLRRGRTCAALAIAALMGLSAESDAGVTLKTATLPGGNTYTVVADPAVTWSQASQLAANDGGFLASINSAAEQAFVAQLMGDAGAPGGAYWIGLQRSGNNFGWASGEPLSFTNWHAGQPDNNGGNETVGAILWSNSGDNAAGAPGTWNDLPDPYNSAASTYVDLNNGGFIVEQAGPAGTPAAVPLPAAILMAPVGMIIVGVAMRRLRRQSLQP